MRVLKRSGVILSGCFCVAVAFCSVPAEEPVAAAGAALVVSKQPEMVEQAAAVGTEKKSKGYQLSEHVKTYYRTLLV